jgi:hypothetical protein
MKRHKLMIMGVLGLIAWFGMAGAFARAQTSVIYPVHDVYPYGPNHDLGFTISLHLPPSDQDVTAWWLPKPGGPEVEIVVKDFNGIVQPANFTLVSPSGDDPIVNGALTTSAYPGECTNFGSTTDPDFTLDGPILIPEDSGGMAVVQVSIIGAPSFFVIIPQDDDFDGIPNIYEEHCPSGDCIREDDIDTGPEADSPIGDGIANIDEYRGFRASGEYVRGNPERKDLFVHLVETSQCMDTAGTDVSLATYFEDFTLLFENLNTLMPQMEIHRLCTEEWIDKFSEYTLYDRVVLTGTPEEQRTDRQINQNALFPRGNLDYVTGQKITKGVRIIECLDLELLSPLGAAFKGPPDGFYKDDGNALIYTQRIVEDFNYRFDLGENRSLKHFTFENGDWNLKWTGEGSPTDDDKKYILKKALGFYLAHEAGGHSTDLTPTQEGTKKEPVGYHHVSGTGTNIDIRIVHKVDKKPAGYNNFYIPMHFGISDKRDMRLLSAQ